MARPYSTAAEGHKAGSRRPASDARLRRELEAFLAGADAAAMVRRDPVERVRQYAREDDQEVAGLLVAGLAYGRASVVRERTKALLDALGPHPARALAGPAGPRRLRGFVYRLQRGTDLPRYAGAIGRVRAEWGSLRAAFFDGFEPEGPGPWLDAMARFVDRVRAHLQPPLSYGLRYLLPTPRSGAAKRLSLYLRWMVRPDDGVDLGTWGGPADRLLIPLDTHVARIGRYVGLTDRQTAGLPAALDITARLARLHPPDPLRYDMALCHLGISGACPTRRVPKICRSCPIRGICRL